MRPPPAVCQSRTSIDIAFVIPRKFSCRAPHACARRTSLLLIDAIKEEKLAHGASLVRVETRETASSSGTSTRKVDFFNTIVSEGNFRLPHTRYFMPSLRGSRKAPFLVMCNLGLLEIIKEGHQTVIVKQDWS
jgi:hypothetical protein